jgi:hypothetical protein
MWIWNFRHSIVIWFVMQVDTTSYRADHLNQMHWNSFSKSSARRTLLAYPFTRSLTRSLTHLSLAHSHTHSLITRSLAHSLTHRSPTHSLTHHSLTHPHKLSSASRWYLSGLSDLPTFWRHNFQYVFREIAIWPECEKLNSIRALN